MENDSAFREETFVPKLYLEGDEDKKIYEPLFAHFPLFKNLQIITPKSMENIENQMRSSRGVRRNWREYVADPCRNDPLRSIGISDRDLLNWKGEVDRNYPLNVVRTESRDLETLVALCAPSYLSSFLEKRHLVSDLSSAKDLCARSFYLATLIGMMCNAENKKSVCNSFLDKESRISFFQAAIGKGDGRPIMASDFASEIDEAPSWNGFFEQWFSLVAAKANISGTTDETKIKFALKTSATKETSDSPWVFLTENAPLLCPSEELSITFDGVSKTWSGCFADRHKNITMFRLARGHDLVNFINEGLHNKGWETFEDAFFNYCNIRLKSESVSEESFYQNFQKTEMYSKLDALINKIYKSGSVPDFSSFSIAH